MLSVLTGEASEPTTTVALPPTVKAPETPTPAEPAASPAYQEAIAGATAATAELATAETSADWDSIADRWQRAIVSLGDIASSSDNYSQA